MSPQEVFETLTDPEGWSLDRTGTVFSRRFEFDNRAAALQFLAGTASQLPGDRYRITLFGNDVIVSTARPSTD